MPIGIMFWVIMIVWLVFGFWQNGTELRAGRYGPIGGSLLTFVLLALLGWAVFGPALHR